MRVFALDLSTHAGYALFEGERGEKPRLEAHGTVHLGKPILKFGPYPECYYRAAREQISSILNVIEGMNPDVLVVEEVNLGKNRYSQKVLDFLHCLLLDELEVMEDDRRPSVVYLDTSSWRSNLGLTLSKDQKRANSKLSRAKRVAEIGGVKLDKKALGIRGKVTWKHLAVDRAKAETGLDLKQKDNDLADAICIGLAYFNGATPCDGV